MAELQTQEDAKRFATEMKRRMEAGSLSPEQRDKAIQVLTAFRERQAQPVEQEAPAAGPEPTGTDNLAGALGGIFGEETGRSIAESPASDFLTGVGRAVTSTVRGLKQLAATPEEALALGKIEERERANFAEVDEGLGLEDIGEAVGFIGTLLIPGGNGVKAAQAGAKALNAIKAVPGSLLGTSLLGGLLEGSKAITAEESRGQNAATAAAFTALGGAGFNASSSLIKNSFKEGAMGKVMSALGVASLQGQNEARRRTTGGLASWFGRKLFGREVKDDIGVAAGRVQAGAERQGQTLSRKAVEARAAEASRGGLAAGDPVWDSWLNLVKGPKGKPTKTGKQNRRKASGLAGAAPSKTRADAIAEAGLDVPFERNRIVSTLMSNAQKETELGVVFDVKQARRAWDTLKEMPQFKAVYTTKLKSGTEKLGTKAQAVEDFLDNLLTQGIPAGEGVTVRASQVLAEGAKDIVEGGAQAADRIRAAAAKPKVQPKPTKSQINSRAAGVLLQQFQSQELLEDAEKNIVTGGWFGFMDYFDSLEEQARKAATGED